jgi:3-phenylpropionate/trans-cinnamate dioxygenase ferredoxin reductase subunit
MATVVVVGGGIAGVSTIAALRAGGFDGELTLVDAGDIPYDRPPLSKDYLAGRTEFNDIALQRPQWYGDHYVRLITQATVAALRTDVGAVELGDGTIVPADRVVLATGGGASRPPIPGADSPRVHVLRTAEDADRLRAVLVPGARILIVGAGLIGAEVASTARQLGCEVVLVDPVAPPLASAVSPGVATWLHGLHEKHDVTTVQAAVESFDETANGISVTLAGEDAPRKFDAALLAVGMAPETALAETAGLHVDRGIVVDAGQVTSNRAVLAVGDVARGCVDGVLARRSEHWEAAQLDGQRAAARILGIAPPADTAPWFWTDRYDIHVEVVGELDNATRFAHRGVLGQPPFSVFGLRDGRLVAAVAVDDSTAVRASRRIIDRGIPVDPDELTDSTTDLRKLLKRDVPLRETATRR